MDATDLPSLSHLRSATTLEGAPPFHVSIVVGPGFVPMDIVGVQTVLGRVDIQRRAIAAPARWIMAPKLTSVLS